jgi:hypothetical protein
MKRFILKAMCASAGIILAGSAGVRADTVLYENTATNLGYNLLFNNNDLIGQQVWLGTGASPFNLTGFSFEYYSPNTHWVGSVTADVRFYENDGPATNGYNAPSTLFYNSGPFSITPPLSFSPSNQALLVFDITDLQSGDGPGAVTMSPGFVMPSNFTFTVQFSGLAGLDTVGLPIFDTPQVGANSGDYWFDVSGNWELLTNVAGPIAFGAEFTGTPQPTPEPSVICLSALGAAAFAIIARRRQRRG